MLEAIFSECNVVASGERAKEYLGNLANYCDPASIESISTAIKNALSAEKPKPSLEMQKLYTWDWVAGELCTVYNELVYGHI